MDAQESLSEQLVCKSRFFALCETRQSLAKLDFSPTFAEPELSKASLLRAGFHFL